MLRDRTDRACFSRLANDIRPGNTAGLFLQQRNPHGAKFCGGDCDVWQARTWLDFGGVGLGLRYRLPQRFALSWVHPCSSFQLVLLCTIQGLHHSMTMWLSVENIKMYIIDRYWQYKMQKSSHLFCSLSCCRRKRNFHCRHHRSATFKQNISVMKDWKHYYQKTSAFHRRVERSIVRNSNW